MNTLITGGAGYIGSTVSNYLIDRGHQVTIIDNLSTFFKLDISDTKKIEKVFYKKKFDVVFHFAAFINNEESIKNPKKYYQNNFLKGKIFFENCMKNKVNKFVYSSTAAVYGNKDKKVNEKDQLKPMSAYPKSKLKLENFLKKKKKLISCVILRYFNVAGADQKLRCGFNVKKGYNLILNLCSAGVKNRKFTINGNNYKTKDGTPIRDYIHVEDLAKIHLLTANLIQKKKMFKVFNCGYGHGFSVSQILRKFNSLLKNKINYKIGKRRNSDIVISIANPNKLIKYTNWRPKFNNLNYILKSSLSWYRKNT